MKSQQHSQYFIHAFSDHFFYFHSCESSHFVKKKRHGGVNEKYVEGVVARNNTRKCMKIVVEERKARQGSNSKKRNLCVMIKKGI